MCCPFFYDACDGRADAGAPDTDQEKAAMLNQPLSNGWKARARGVLQQAVRAHHSQARPCVTNAWCRSWTDL